MKKTEKLSISIPFYNEESGIPHLNERLSNVILELEKTVAVELILVDDGSTDKTFDLLKKHFPDALLVKHPKNFGIGAAMRSGFKNATGDFIAFLDSDCTYAPEEIIPMLKIMQKSPKIDIISASQYHPDGGIKDVPAWRLFFSKGASFVYRLILPKKLYTYTGFMRIYRKRVVGKLNFFNDGFIAVTEILVRAICLGFNIVEYPTVLSVRKFGASKIKVLNVILEHIRFISGLRSLKKELGLEK
ncbi:MAG: glycosyltransferase family 2 protein [Candidatus Saganbacteria bacterium]|nr:glycosyltransferase family 2 protein [Candidatus Saganbacteria bacterium]